MVLISLPPSLTSFPGPRFSFPEFCPTGCLLLRESPAQAGWSDLWKEESVFYWYLCTKSLKIICFPFCTPGTALGEEVLNDLATVTSFCDYLSILRYLIHDFFLNSTHFWLPVIVLRSTRPYTSTGARTLFTNAAGHWGIEIREWTLPMSLGVSITWSAAVREGEDLSRTEQHQSKYVPVKPKSSSGSGSL